MNNYKAPSRLLFKFVLIVLPIISLLGCRINEYYYTDWESHKLVKGYERSVVTIGEICCRGEAIKTLDYEFKARDVLIKQERQLGSNVSHRSVPLYPGSKFEIIFNPKDPKKNTILLNKPVYDDNVQFEKAVGEIKLITWKQRGVFIYNGFIKIRCMYKVNGESYFIIANVSKDIFFPNKEYDEITRKDFRKINRKYKGQKCEVEYDINNPGVSRLIEKSIVSNEKNSFGK